eukprot:1011242-Pelagomonas_calceolata.AAC.1
MPDLVNESTGPGKSRDVGLSRKASQSTLWRSITVKTPGPGQELGQESARGPQAAAPRSMSPSF